MAAALVGALVLVAGPALSGDVPRPSLAEAMNGAEAMAAVANYLFVAKADGAFVCAINVSSNHFAALIEGDDVVAEQTVPGAVCVPAEHFENLAE